VLVRNAFEQRRELSLLRAVGYRASHVRKMVLAETALLLLLGLAIGAGAALVAIAPGLAERATWPSLAPVLLLLAAVAATGLVVARVGPPRCCGCRCSSRCARSSPSGLDPQVRACGGVNGRIKAPGSTPRQSQTPPRCCSPGSPMAQRFPVRPC